MTKQQMKKNIDNNNNNGSSATFSTRERVEWREREKKMQDKRNRNSLAHEMKTYRKSIAVRCVCLRTIYWFSLSVDVQWIFDFFFTDFFLLSDHSRFVYVFFF